MSEPTADEAPDPTPESPRVAALRAELASLDELEIDAHPETYQRIHAELQDALAGIDDA